MRVLALSLLFLSGCASTSPDLYVEVADIRSASQIHCDEDWQKLRKHNRLRGGKVYYNLSVDSFGNLYSKGPPSCSYIHKELIKKRVKDHGKEAI